MNNLTKIFIALMLSLFFTIGMLSGIIIERSFNRSVPPRDPEFVDNFRAMPFPDEIEKAFIVEKFIERMDNDFSLDKEQMEKLIAIIGNHEKKLIDVRTGIFHQLSDLDKQLYNDIETILNDEQKIRFKEKYENWTRPLMIGDPDEEMDFRR